jgi:hypothetical protein
MSHRLVPLSVTPFNRPKQVRPSTSLAVETLLLLDPQRRSLFAQRLALLIRRIRTATPIPPKKEVPYEH